MRHTLRASLLGSFAILALTHCGTAYIERETAGPDYLIQGEYAAEGAAIAAQVVARGDAAFVLNVFEGGLPGDGWNGLPPQRAMGSRASQGSATSTGEVRFTAAASTATLVNGTLTLTGWSGARAAAKVELRRIERHSPTEGLPAPEGAHVLFAEARDGVAAVNATDGSVDTRGWLEVGAQSDEAFGSMQLHLEFRTPYMPDSLGQARGNSGVYLQRRYEVQVLDSFGLDAAWDDCAGIYKVAAPSVNMSFPPLQWQTYDIEFEAASFDASGNKRAPARVTVRHNGVLVQDRVAIPEPTGLGDSEGPEPGRLLLQNHLNPVVYRNIWAVPR